MMKRWLAVVVALAALSGTASAQNTVLAGGSSDIFGHATESPAGGGALGFLNASNFKISNQTSFSVTSGSGGSLSQGINLTRLTYVGSKSLSVSAGLGNLFMSNGSYFGYSAKPGFFLNDLSVRYQPSEHSTISFQFVKGPGYEGSPYRSGYWDRGYFGDLPFVR